jgi:diguanylate cyclase
VDARLRLTRADGLRPAALRAATETAPETSPGRTDERPAAAGGRSSAARSPAAGCAGGPGAQEIGRGLERPQLFDELRLEYQPIYTLATGEIERVEALLRWRHPRFGVIPPLLFIPHAEHTGRIQAIGRWVMATACGQIAAWNRHLRPHAPLVAAVNVSAHQLTNPDFADEVHAALEGAELDPALLLLEVTESSAVATENVHALRNLETIRTLGAQIAVDDFGTGYSSLEYLARLPVDAVKIDRVFVERLSDPRGRRLFQGIVDLARALDLQTVAEGIETAAELETVTGARCSAAQGYLLSHPLPPALVAYKLRSRLQPQRPERTPAAARSPLSPWQLLRSRPPRTRGRACPDTP